MTKRVYGWKPDLPNKDDHYLGLRSSLVSLPPAFSLKDGMPPVYNQGSLGSCTSNAICAAYDFDNNKEHASFYFPSRLFHYYQERELENSIQYDSGAMIRDGIKVIGKVGVCKETDWPYDVAKFRDRPSATSYINAKQHTALEYARVDQSSTAIKSAIFSGFPVVFGFTVYESFEGSVVEQTGIMPMPAHGERALGGHAVLCTGWNDANCSFEVRNSWGASWGVGGYFFMPYQYLLDSDLAADLWVIRRVN